MTVGDRREEFVMDCPLITYPPHSPPSPPPPLMTDVGASLLGSFLTVGLMQLYVRIRSWPVMPAQASGQTGGYCTVHIICRPRGPYEAVTTGVCVQDGSGAET